MNVGCHAMNVTKLQIDSFGLALSFAAILFFLGACTSPFSTYEEPARKVQESDVSGVWQYDAYSTGAQLVTLELDIHGIFTITGSLENSGIGNWTLVNNSLRFEYVTQERTATMWYVSEDSDSNLVIVGNDIADPDYWREMIRIR